jgi:2-dehydro-3-deoxyglucarate aldolase
VACGIFALDVAGAREYRAAGFRFIALAADVIWMLRATRQALQEVRL